MATATNRGTAFVVHLNSKPSANWDDLDDSLRTGVTITPLDPLNNQDQELSTKMEDIMKRAKGLRSSRRKAGNTSTFPIEDWRDFFAEAHSVDSGRSKQLDAHEV
jgi:hypothetical protein